MFDLFKVLFTAILNCWFIIPFDNLLPFILAFVENEPSSIRIKDEAGSRNTPNLLSMSFENNVFSEILCFLQWYQETGRWS